MLGQTTSQISGKTKGEKLNLILQTNQSDHSDLLGATVTVSFLGGEESYVWDGNRIVVEIPGMLQYTVTVSDVPNYKTPDPVTYTAIEGNTVSVIMTYQCELLTVNVSADEGSVSGYEVTVSKVETIGVSEKYIRLEYIESTGTQYIDTGYKHNQDTRLVAHAKVTKKPSSHAWLFEGRIGNGGGSNMCAKGLLLLAGETWNVDYWDTGNNRTVFSDIGVTDDLNIDYNKNSITINEYSKSWDAKTFQSTANLVLFAANTNGSVSGYISARLYSCQIYDNEILVRNYIPALRSDGVAGLYDTVNNTFYVSNGTGNFIAGSVISELIATQTSITKSYKIPFNVGYAVQSSKVDGYDSPARVIRIANIKSYTVSQQYTVITVRDLSLQDVYGNPINRSTANCYVVREPGTYTFPCVYGNAIKNGLTNPAAFKNNGRPRSHNFVNGKNEIILSPYLSKNIFNPHIVNSDIDNSIISDIKLTEEDEIMFYCFTIDSMPESGGNIIFSLMDYDMYILWSWHIWLWPYELSSIEITNSTNVKYNIMSVNLASQYDNDGIHIKNWFYQWGRPNPMLSPESWNSTSDNLFGEITSISSNAADLATGLQNITDFYCDGTFSGSWFSYEPYYNLWDSAFTSVGNSDNDTVKTVYDPCPVGWKVPNGNTFTGMSIIDSDNNGIVKMTRYNNDTIGVNFYLTGNRGGMDGKVFGTGTQGYIWLSSNISLDSASYLDLSQTSVSTKSMLRSYGCSIRPVEDNMTDIDIVDTIITIEFLINSSYFYAEPNMTWSEWINSDYNTGYNSFEIENKDGKVYIGASWLYMNNNQVSVSDKIVDGGKYTWTYY